MRGILSAVSVFALFIYCYKFFDVSTQFVNNSCCKFISHLISGDVDKLASLKSTTPKQVVEAHLVSTFVIQWVLRMDKLFDHVGEYFSRAFQHLVEAKVLDPFVLRFHHSFDEVVGVTGWGSFFDFRVPYLVWNVYWWVWNVSLPGWWKLDGNYLRNTSNI